MIKDGTVTWEPAFDLSRVVLRGQLVGVVALLSLRWIARSVPATRLALSLVVIAQTTPT